MTKFTRIVATGNFPPQYPKAKQQQLGTGAFTLAPAPAKKTGYGQLRLQTGYRNMHIIFFAPWNFFEGGFSNVVFFTYIKKTFDFQLLLAGSGENNLAPAHGQKVYQYEKINSKMFTQDFKTKNK